jgi:cellulose synthase/poly-beta-1,6-N-acetylglucosamine synthase-like glycosyltransferase
MESLPLFTGIIISLAGIFYCSLISMFTFGWYRPKGSVTAKTISSYLKVSVIIAARDEEYHIADLLGDLLIQDYPVDLTEVIVVDDHSKDKTAEIVTDFITSNDLSRFRIIKNDDDKAGKKLALNLGITNSTGDLIMTTDADCRVGREWISSLASYFQDEMKMIVFGPVSFFPGKGLLNQFQSLEFLGLMASGAGAAGAGHPFICSGASLAYRKSVFQRVNGFKDNERFISGDDVFLMHNIKKVFGSKSIDFSYNKRSLVQTYPAPGLRAFFNQRIRWASKSKGYNDPLSLITSITVFVFNFILSATFFAGFFQPLLFLIFAGFLMLKSLIDLPLILGVTHFTGNRRLMRWYLQFQVIYPFYIVVTGVLSLFPKRNW